MTDEELARLRALRAQAKLLQRATHKRRAHRLKMPPVSVSAPEWNGWRDRYTELMEEEARMRDALFWILDGDDAPAKEENNV